MPTLRVLVFWLALIGSVSAAEPPVMELMLKEKVLGPASTLEFRFARPMIAAEQVGLALEAPIAIAPAVAGKFTWLSRRSGVFVAEGPWPLGTKFQVSSRAGLVDAAGAPLPAYRTELETPVFGPSAVWTNTSNHEVAAKPKIAIAFYLKVQLASAEGLFRFVDAQGHSIPAQVRFGLSDEYFPEKDQEDWQTRWEHTRSGAPTVQDDTAQDGPPGEPVLNRLIITPTRPLTTGSEWRLEMKPGLQAAGSALRVATPLREPLGAVKPFALTKVEASSYINSGRSVTLDFSASLAPDITLETASKYLQVTPAVPNLRFEPEGERITLRGDFQLGTAYELTLNPELLSEEGLPLEGERQRLFRFAPVRPRLYLPTITGHQLRSGGRKFEVLSVNLKSLHVVARLVTPAEAPQAVAAFEKYLKEETTEDGELYQPLPPKSIRGKVIYNRRLELPAPAFDARQMTALNWNEILGGPVAGTVFLTVEGESLPEAGPARPAAQALLQLTDLGLLWKQTRAGMRVAVFSMETGHAVPGARLTLLDENFAPAGRGSTDAEGTATISAGALPVWLVATHGDDAQALRLGTDLPMAAFNLPLDYLAWEDLATPPPAYRALIFTDRPLYQPGETVKIKGLVRNVSGPAPALAAGVKGSLIPHDPRGNDLEAIAIQTDAHGSFDAEFKLGMATRGNFSLSLALGEESRRSGGRGFSCFFEVADYQPNAFELAVNLPARLAPEAAVQAEVSAQYFFGAPLTEAQARWTLRYVQETFAPEGFGLWHFGEEESPAGKALTLHGEEALHDQKGFSIQPKLPAAGITPSRGLLTVEVTDQNQQTVSETRPFVRDAGDFYLGLKTPEGVIFHPDGTIEMQAVAVRPDGQPLPEPVAVHGELIYVREETVRVQGADHAVSFRTEKYEKTVAEGEGRTLLPFNAGSEWLAPPGPSLTFPTGRAGMYRLRVTAKDGHGRRVSSVLPVFVSGPEEITWEYRNPQQIDLMLDKHEYHPGDTARVLVKTPIAGEALVTIEREARILRTLHVRLEGNAPVLEIPLTAEDAPNVFVSVLLLRGREESTRKIKTPEYRYGTAMLSVADPATQLQVAVTPAQPTVLPGAAVEAEVRVRDHAGAAVGDAEVTFFAVDDGVLALTGYERPQPAKIFGAPFPLGVRTGLSLYELLPEEPGALQFSNKGYLIGGGGLEGPGRKLRENFPGTACWFPALRTDAQGLVRVRFTAPEALTRYRLVAVVSAGTHAYGSAESAVTLRQPLMVLPALGQFANTGDELLARAVIRNETGAAGTAEIDLELDATAEPTQPGAGGLHASLLLRAGEARAVDFPVRLRATGPARWKWRARLPAGGETYTDEVASALTVGSPAVQLRETYLSELSPGAGDLLQGVNPQVLEGTGTAEVTVSNSRLIGLNEGAHRLLEYPYGCAEQTASALMPWILLPELRPFLTAVAKTDEEAHTVIGKGVAKLFSMQVPGGGIAMWPGARQPSVYLSVYAALVMGLLPPAETPAEPAKALLDFLSASLHGENVADRSISLSDEALALWALALAGRPEAAYHETLFQRRRELTREARGLLALAIAEAGGPKSMQKELLDLRTPAPEETDWFGGVARERAILLLAWSRYQPRAQEVGRLVKELLAFRKNGHWTTTQQNAWALLALARYYAAAEPGAAREVQAALVRGGTEQPFKINRAQPVFTQAYRFAPGQSPLEALSLRQPAKSLLFGETRFAVYPPLAAQPRQDRGFAVSRSYRKLAADGSEGEARELKVGDRVLVTLRVETTHAAHFVAIDDPLPAVLEAVNPAFASRGGGERASQPWESDFREIRADRVLYFCDHLPAGTYHFQYLARVRTAGKATAGATKAEEMYQPERFGLGETTRLEAK